MTLPDCRLHIFTISKSHLTIHPYSATFNAAGYLPLYTQVAFPISDEVIPSHSSCCVFSVTFTLETDEVVVLQCYSPWLLATGHNTSLFAVLAFEIAAVQMKM